VAAACFHSCQRHFGTSSESHVRGAGHPQQSNKNSARRLGELDEEKLFTRISARYPNLKEDLKDLTYLVSYFAEHKKLPERQLLLETLDDDEISTLRQSGLRDLVSFC
jgi:hypothetical protein